MFSKSALTMLGFLLGAVVVGGLAKRNASTPSPEMAAVCEGGPLRSVQARQRAQEDGYDINRQHD